MIGGGARRQRGAVAVTVAVAIGACLIAVALVIDIGRLYSAQRQLEQLAGIAALDAARVTGGCMGLPDDPAFAAFSEADASVRRNLAGSGVPVNIASVRVGSEVRASDGHRYFSTVPADSHAVEVVLSRPAPARIIPMMDNGAGDRRLVASAAAQSRPTATVHIGTRLAEFDPTFLNRFLSEALGGTVDIAAVGYTSLFEANVPLEAILDALGPGSPSDVFEQTVSVADILTAVVDALANTADATAVAAASQIADAVSSTATVTPAQLVGIEQNLVNVLSGTLINAGQLTLAAAAAASSSPVIEVLYGLPPPFGNSEFRIRLIDPGEQVPLTPGQEVAPDGTPNYASTAQGLVEATLGFRLDVLDTEVVLPLWLEVAQATARVDDIECAREGVPEDTVVIDARTSLSRVGIGRFDDISRPEPQPEPAPIIDADFSGGVLGIPVPVHIRVTAAAYTDVPSERRRLPFTSPFEPQEIGGSLELGQALASLPESIELQVDIVPAGTDGGLLAGTVNAALQSTIDVAKPLLEAALRNQLADLLLPAGDELTRRVLGSIGLSVGNAEVDVIEVVAKEPYIFTR
ncbi:MAG: pilus assembly protein TadG-related protein [Nevskiales bacterium]|nr:pilus assembly protein TadG-related protein [Nevskiales bacterium]